jgi:NADPH-dependent glutamate synthase beta subunit-like oxidoreductase
MWFARGMCFFISDDAIAIRYAKRFMSDAMYAEPWTPPKHAPHKNIKVAVVGSGPCGLTAALRLAQSGYELTVYERMPQPGGMMTYGIPAYRLPRAALFAEIDHHPCSRLPGGGWVLACIPSAI